MPEPRNDQPLNIYILGFDQAYAASLVGLTDIFQLAETLSREQADSGAGRKLIVKLASVDGKPILCQNNILLNVHCAAADIDRADILIITSIHDMEGGYLKYNHLADWLKEIHGNGTTLVSVCTGAFLLAETGLLDYREATTHWSAAPEFRARFPHVRLREEQLIINHGSIYCAAGAGAGTDLAYYFLEKYFGHAAAVRTAKFFVHDFRRTSQTAYAIFDKRTGHNDSGILKVQEWIEAHLNEPILVNDLAGISCMSHRTFERRFKKATGHSPLAYIQMLRVEVAKQQLETTDLSFNEIAYNLGYENSGAFRKIFIKRAGLLPIEYRTRFQAYRN